MSTTTSRIRPSKHCTYFAWPGGTSAKCTPRTVPAFETEMFICCRSSGWPMASSNTEALKDSRKTPRSSGRRTGVNSHTPSMPRAVTSTPRRLSVACWPRGPGTRGRSAGRGFRSIWGCRAGSHRRRLRVGPRTRPSRADEDAARPGTGSGQEAAGHRPGQLNDVASSIAVLGFRRSANTLLTHGLPWWRAPGAAVIGGRLRSAFGPPPDASMPGSPW